LNGQEETFVKASDYKGSMKEEENEIRLNVVCACQSIFYQSGQPT
jgi:hypothetical protein